MSDSNRLAEARDALRRCWLLSGADPTHEPTDIAKAAIQGVQDLRDDYGDPIEAARVTKLENDYAALLAEHEALLRRVAEVSEARSERDRMFLSAREWAERFGQMEARAERLEEALRDALEYLQHHLPDETLAPHRAALQETGNADARIVSEPGEVGRG